MCGISGIYLNNSIRNKEKRIKKMNDALNHRGPDSQGVYEDKNIALGFRRLAIIDLDERANQPMHSIDNKWHIVFNGEIYNFQEIKNSLKYDFKTKSDTEVIIASVYEKGVEWFLSRANGMFSLALYNSETKDLILARDRLGIKPLYYTKNSSGLIFSSEIKGILSSGLVDADFNDNAIDEYLGNRYIRAPYTFFKNIFQVKPGTYFHINSNMVLKEKEYWQLPSDFNLSTNYSEEKILEEFEDKLTQSINYRLISDVPLGTYLSGGVDSSLITAIAASNKKNRINTYTIGFKEMNEFSYADQVAKKYNTNHHKILMKKDDYINGWKKLIADKDSPLGVPNEIPLAAMSTKLKEKITVVLSGEGADELMGGYGRIFRSPLDYANQNKYKSFYNFFISEYEYVPRLMRDQLLLSSAKYREEFDSKLKNDFSDPSMEKSIFHFFHRYHVQGLLQRVDITTMQTSVEARVPFLDHELIEHVYAKIPLDLKLKWNSKIAKKKALLLSAKEYSEILDTPKYLIRKLSYKYLPKNIVERKKVGFPVPLSEWFGDLELLAHELLDNCSWLHKNNVQDLIEKSKIEIRSGQILWMFINIELFKNIYFKKSWRW